jgi:hypothetical protein
MIKSTREYFKRKPRANERYRVQRVETAARQLLALDPLLSEVDVQIRNTKNPNGFNIRVQRDGPAVKAHVGRFIMTQWAREHGYYDACETKTDKKKFAKKFPHLLPSWCAYWRFL